MPGLTLRTVDPPARESAAGLRVRWDERRRLADRDRHAAHNAEAYLLGVLLAEACELVRAGWVQHCWFAVIDEQGALRRIGPRNLDEIGGHPVSAVCLLGGIVQAAGGVTRAGTRPVHRAIDLTWATLYDQPVRPGASSRLRLAHIHDLIGWNDSAGRTRDDVAGLLTAASRRATQ
jgi:hypothetical protein